LKSKEAYFFVTGASLLLQTSCIANEDVPYFQIVGRIDEELLKKIYETPVNYKKIVIKSQGGDIDSAIKIGYFIKKNNIKIVVRGYCLSACSTYILPSSRYIEIEDNSVIGLHTSSNSMKNILYINGFIEESRKYTKLSEHESKYFEFVGTNKKTLYDWLYNINPECFIFLNKKGLARISSKYSFYTPSREDYEKWIGRKVYGYWPINESEFINAVSISIPKGVSVSFNFRKKLQEKKVGSCSPR
jgi:hypothetical protein